MRIAYNKTRRPPRTRANRQIRVPEVRVIDDEGEQLGVMPTHEALAKAQELGLDLVEVSPTARPPVCRIMDFGRYKYELSKKQKQSKKKQHQVQVKEVKLRPKTEEHDFQFKKRHAEEFLEKHHKVKFTLLFRGREMDHRERGTEMLNRMIKELSHVGTVERAPMFEGRIMVMYMAPLSTHVNKPAKSNKPKPAEVTEQKPTSAEPVASSAELKEGQDAKAEDKPRGDETIPEDGNGSDSP